MDLSGLAKQLVKGVSNRFVYDPQTKRSLPNSLLYDIAETSKHKVGSKDYLDSQMNLGSNIVFGGMTTPIANRTLLPKPGQKVLENSGFIENLAKRYEGGANQIKPGQMVDIDLEPQARAMYQQLFNKKTQAPVGQVIGKLYEALQGYRTEQSMKAGGELGKSAMGRVLQMFRK